MARAKLKKQGGGSLRRAPAVQRFTSGCTLLDCINGGGWAEGRVINVIGDSMVGKTLLAEEAAANYAAKYADAKIHYVEGESRFDVGYAEMIGIPMDRIDLIEDIETVEALFRKMEEWIKKSQEPSLIVVDSLDSLTDEAEVDRDIGKGSMGMAKAKKMSELFRRLCRQLAVTNATVLIVSQVRMKMDVAWGNPWCRTGGKALDFYASQIVWLFNKGKIKKRRKGIERIVGANVRARNAKNVGRPHRECEFPLLFEFGTEDVEANLHFLKSIPSCKDLWPEDGGIEKILRQVPSMDTSLWRTWQRRSARVVKRVWNEIEKDFEPGRRKYG